LKDRQTSRSSSGVQVRLLLRQVRAGESWFFNEIARPIVLRDQLLNLFAQSIVARASLDDIFAALARRQVNRRLEHFLNLLPTVRGHKSGKGVIDAGRSVKVSPLTQQPAMILTVFALVRRARLWPSATGA
jgi:hypothetical protein